MTVLVHNYSHLAGQTVLWDTADSEQKFLAHLNDPDKKQKLDSLGYLNNPITYTFNSQGFRSQEFGDSIDMVCFGCSFTMGTGVHIEHTWPMHIQSSTAMSVANLGHAGSSNDTAFRFASHYLPKLRPRYAVWLQTDKHRLELLDEHVPVSINIVSTDSANPCARDFFIKTWFSSEINQQLNLDKNTLAFEKLCLSLDIKYKIISRGDIRSDKCARDLSHPGPDVHKSIAKQVLHWLG